MQVDGAGVNVPVVAGDVLALRGTGLAAAETWALLCQAAQALQDLFLSNAGVVGGSRIGPVVTPHTIELTPRGRVNLQLASPGTARAYLPPEYRPGRIYSDTDSEKMWMYSLGRALLDTTPQVTALTGTVSVSPSSALQSVLAAMTEPDPRRRASLMSLLDVISEYCRTRLQSKPFTHIVMDMYREVARTAQYVAKQHAAILGAQQQQQNHHQLHHPHKHQHPAERLVTKHHSKSSLFKNQLKNSRSHPNLAIFAGDAARTSQAFKLTLPQAPHHARTNSQPEYTERQHDERTSTTQRVHPGSGDFHGYSKMFLSAHDIRHAQNPGSSFSVGWPEQQVPSKATWLQQCPVPGAGQQQNPVSSTTPVNHRQGPPKPPRIITTLKKTTAQMEQEELPKPPRNTVRARRGKPVQRAPSRLYRGPTRSFNNAPCVGPEFVVRANQPAKVLKIGDSKAGNCGRIIIILLTGQRVEVSCDPQKVTAGDLFRAVVQMENLDENFTLGLAALLAGDFVMLPPETKLNKVSPPGWTNCGKSKGLLSGLPTNFMLYLRFRFFLPSLRGVRSWISKHLLYLQIRRCILEQQLVCSLPQLINLTGLALQAEFGNYSVNEHGCGDYFLLEHYMPESLILKKEEDNEKEEGGTEVLKLQLQRAHRERRGLDSNKAEEMFIAHAQALSEYGSHYYIATIDNKDVAKFRRSAKKADPRVLHAHGNGSDNIYEVHDYRGSHQPMPYDHPANNNNNNNNNNKQKTANRYLGIEDRVKGVDGDKKSAESNVWLAIHGNGLKLFHRHGSPRERTELVKFQWKDIQTLSFNKNHLVVHSRFNGKRCKFKLRMDQKKSYFAFKLTSLHHKFFLKLRSELTSLQGLAKEFGVQLVDTADAKAAMTTPPTTDTGKSRVSITARKKEAFEYPMALEEFQNKENENPQKELLASDREEPEDLDYALYAQVDVRLEPEGQSRDTEDDELFENFRSTDPDKIYSLPGCRANVDPVKPEENLEVLYAAINKVGIPKVQQSPWGATSKGLLKAKTASLPNYATPRKQPRTPSLPRRLGVKMGTRAIYSTSNLVPQRDSILTDTDGGEALSLKSDTTSTVSSARSESPGPEAYVLNADIKTDDETFHVVEDESMSTSLAARLVELSFAEERILRTIKLERGQGGSIGLQVTDGTDNGVYVQAVSVGGSADMAGNVNKGDRIVAINGQSLLNLRYEDALKMLQTVTSDTVELVLSQTLESRRRVNPGQVESNYLRTIRFDTTSEAESSGMTTKWLLQRNTVDVASVQNTSSAYSSGASSSMGMHQVGNATYLTDVIGDGDDNVFSTASTLLSVEDFDVSRTSRQVFI